MTDKQIIIYDQKKTIHRLQDECTEKTNAIITLDEQLKSKEQALQEAMDNYVQLDLQRVKEYNELVDLYKAKEQECEELKAEIKKQKEIAKEYEQRWLNSYGI